MTIRARLLATLLPGLAFALLAGAAAVYLIARADLLRQLDASVRARAEALASLAVSDDGRVEFEYDEGRESGFSDGYFEFRTASGKLLRRSANLAAAELPVVTSDVDGVTFHDVTIPSGSRGRAATLAFTPRVDDVHEIASSRQRDRSRLLVTVAIDRRPTDRALGALLAALGVAGGAAGIVTILLVTLGVRWGLAPLNRLRRQLAGIRGGATSQRLHGAGAPKELAPVYGELNRMLDRVQQTIERERSFADAAAHELRTPLAELRAAAEVAMRWPDPDKAAATLGEVLSIGREMETLVDSLLRISRGERATSNGQASGRDVGSIVRRCVNRLRREIDERQLRLGVELDPPRSFAAPVESVEIILRNLIENAVQYTLPGGEIRIRTEPHAVGAASIVIDNGPVDLVEGDLPRLFEPFWRSDATHTDRSHAGLGLTVVQRVAEATGLRVEASLSGHRLRMQISEPSGTSLAGEPALH